MNVKDYIDGIPESRKFRFLSIVNLVKLLYPNAAESMHYKMPAYEFKEGWTSVANQKNYFSVYTCSPEHIASFKEKYPKIKAGKGCINFGDSDEIPFDELKLVIKNAIERKKI